MNAPPILVLAGVAGSGKTTVGRALATRLGVPFADADDAHPVANRAKMAQGEPLTDADRAPWLDALAATLAGWHAAGTGGVLACSALRAPYRARLASAAPDVRFVLLTATPSTLRARLAARPDHFFPPALLASQLDALDPAGLPAVATDDRTADEVAAAVCALLEPGA